MKIINVDGTTLVDKESGYTIKLVNGLSREEIKRRIKEFKKQLPDNKTKKKVKDYFKRFLNIRKQSKKKSSEVPPNYNISQGQVLRYGERYSPMNEKIATLVHDLDEKRIKGYSVYNGFTYREK